MKVNNEYTSDQIQVLEGLEAVRKRPGMYIGGIAARGLHQLVWEIVDNSIDEALSGNCDKITISITAQNEIIVFDDGRGIPVGTHKKTGISTVETVFTILHAGGKFGGDSGYKVSGGLHGVGASVVNALSSYLEVNVYRDNNNYFQRFINGGKVENPLKIVGTTNITGTKIKFKPDATIFTTTVFDYELLKSRVKQLAYLNKGLELTLIDERTNKKNTYCFAGGVKEYVQDINKNRTVLHNKVVYAEGEYKDVVVELALQYNSTYTNHIYSFCNNINTIEGGTHEMGFRDALVRIFNNYATKHKLFTKDVTRLSGDDVKEGIVAVISIKHLDPIYEGQTKTKLSNPDVRGIVNKIISEKLEAFLMENPDLAKTIINKTVLASKARLAALRARELTRKTPLNDIAYLPGKLSDCASKNPVLSELFIVEGDSAGGSAKLGRNRETQAILPLRGKVINVEKSRIDKVFANNEIGCLIKAFGTSIGEDFQIDKLRYHKIIIMTDADVDGSHIRTLLLTFLFRYFKELIENGFVYIAQPPLYKIKVGKKGEYAYTDQQKEMILGKIDKKSRISIQRYKGLGEMDASQLWETTMDPNTRTLLRVEIQDAAEADNIFSVLMGNDVLPRRKFIQKNASYAKVDV